MMHTENHPIELLPIYRELAERVSPRGHEYEFSRYVYVPQTISESRQIYRAAPDFFAEQLKEHAISLKANEEIALHSRVHLVSGSTAHIPMVDMGCQYIEPYLPELKCAFAYFGVPEFSIYSSGRSFHLYGHALLESDAQFIQFMGRILLLNLPGKERVIDERWVGHRLMAGYSTLRWTNNNPHYKKMPARVSFGLSSV
jgi:hypothetical protein